jgi:hypothetical protein
MTRRYPLWMIADAVIALYMVASGVGLWSTAPRTSAFDFFVAGFAVWSLRTYG